MNGESHQPTASVYQPTASVAALRRRAYLLRSIRRFFEERGYWEVETPLLDREVILDAYLEPFAVPAADGTTYYLQTSPELGMKRLLCAGARQIYQMTKAFRQHEEGRLHNPEFTLLEWYDTAKSYPEQMDFTEEFVRAMFRGDWTKPPASDSTKSPAKAETMTARKNAPAETASSRHPAVEAAAAGKPFERLSYNAAFERYLGVPVLSLRTEELEKLAEAQGIQPPASLRADDRDGWLNLLLSECLEKHLGQSVPLFLYDYPASQAALAKIRDEKIPVAERFELYVGGIELCNGYNELTNPRELQRRMEKQARLRTRESLPPLPPPEQLLRVMEAGLPPSTGVALGVDRLVLLAQGYEHLAEVMSFPIGRR